MGALAQGIKRAVLLWHRRSGKEKTLINYTAWAMLNRVGTYFYIFPTYAQAKKSRLGWTGQRRVGIRGSFPGCLGGKPQFHRTQDHLSQWQYLSVNRKR